jgi:hypothetical protein
MAIQTYTIGQTLTAAQMTALQANDYNQTVSTKTSNYVLVAADKGTRVVMNVSTASTITVNTSLFSAGDTVILQNIGSNASVVTPGTATVSSAGSLSIPQYGSGILYFTSAGVAIFFPSAGPAASSALTFISSGSVGTSLTFSLPANSFTSTYLNYLLIFNGVGMDGGVNIMARMRASGTDYSTADYNFHIGTIDTSGGYAGVGGGATTSEWRIGSANNTSLGQTYGQMYLFSPKAATFTKFNSQMETGGLHTFGGGALSTTTSFDSLTIFSHNGIAVFNNGTYTLYGLANS